MQPPTPSRDRFIANRSAIDLDVARYALDSSTNGNNATNGDGSSASQPDSLLIASPSKVWGKFLDMDFFSVVFYFRPFVVFRDVYLFFLSSSEFVVFFRVVVPLVWKRSVPFSFLLLHKVIFSIDERFVIGFRGKVLSAN